MGTLRGKHRIFSCLLVSTTVLVISCGASMEQTARSELEERGMLEVTLQPLENRRNAYSFESTREEVPCHGEIELRQEMGQTLATVTSQCGEESSPP